MPLKAKDNLLYTTIKNFLMTQNNGNGYGQSSEDLAKLLDAENPNIKMKIPNHNWITFKNYINEVKKEMGGCGKTGWCKGGRKKRRRSRRKSRRGNKSRKSRRKRRKSRKKRKRRTRRRRRR